MMQGSKDGKMRGEGCEPEDAVVRHVKYEAFNPDGSITSLWLQHQDLASMQPGAYVSNYSIFVVVASAVRHVRNRTGKDVRAVTGTTWQSWLRYTRWDQERRLRQGTPKTMIGCGFREADYVLLPWVVGLHWSSLILCHPGNELMR